MDVLLVSICILLVGWHSSVECVSCMLKCRQYILYKKFISGPMKKDLRFHKSGVTCDPHWLVNVNGLTLLYVREKAAVRVLY